MDLSLNGSQVSLKLSKSPSPPSHNALLWSRSQISLATREKQQQSTVHYPPHISRPSSASQGYNRHKFPSRALRHRPLSADSRFLNKNLSGKFTGFEERHQQVRNSIFSIFFIKILIFLGKFNKNFRLSSQ